VSIFSIARRHPWSGFATSLLFRRGGRGPLLFGRFRRNEQQYCLGPTELSCAIAKGFPPAVHNRSTVGGFCFSGITEWYRLVDYGAVGQLDINWI
jgi:hypothetical protein